MICNAVIFSGARCEIRNREVEERVDSFWQAAADWWVTPLQTDAVQPNVQTCKTLIWPHENIQKFPRVLNHVFDGTLQPLGLNISLWSLNEDWNKMILTTLNLQLLIFQPLGGSTSYKRNIAVLSPETWCARCVSCLFTHPAVTEQL